MSTNALRALHDVHAVYDGVFNAYSGQKIDLINPDSKMIRIQDISSALSLICRFGGHSGRFYSVSQHSVLVAALAPEDLKQAALLHDAAEAYLGDVIKPLKVLIGERYAQLEKAFESAIAERFSINPNGLEAVKPYDRRALELEHAFLQKREENEWRLTMQRLQLPTEPLAPGDSANLFNQHFLNYFPLHNEKKHNHLRSVFG